jgi:hypothetical protein
VIPLGHEDIANVAPDIHLLDMLVVAKTIQRQMRLHNAPVSLLLKPRHHDFKWRAPTLDPGRQLKQRRRQFMSRKNEIGDDTLHRRGSRLAPG